jgi:hypothetical protein
MSLHETPPLSLFTHSRPNSTNLKTHTHTRTLREPTKLPANKPRIIYQRRSTVPWRKLLHTYDNSLKMATMLITSVRSKPKFSPCSSLRHMREWWYASKNYIILYIRGLFFLTSDGL